MLEVEFWFRSVKIFWGPRTSFSLEPPLKLPFIRYWLCIQCARAEKHIFARKYRYFDHINDQMPYILCLLMWNNLWKLPHPGILLHKLPEYTTCYVNTQTYRYAHNLLSWRTRLRPFHMVSGIARNIRALNISA